MISVLNVTKAYHRGRRPLVILDRAELRVEARDRVGILAKSGTGKTTMARLLAGAEDPDTGRIVRAGSLSWPIGFSSAFHPALSPAENVAIVAGLYNLDATELSVRVAQFAALGGACNQPLVALSPGQRNQLGMALSLTVPFDIYLADEFSAVGSPAFQDRIEAALEDRLERSGLILLTRHAHTIKRLATRFVALAGGKLIECASADEAEDVLSLVTNPETDAHAA